MHTSTLHDSSVERQRLTTPVVCLFYALLTIAMTWPQAAHLASIPEHVDAWFSLWRIAWIAHQLPRAPLHLFDGNILYPASNTLAYSDAVLLPGIIGAPFIWLGVPVVVVYNLLVMGSFVACATSMFVLVRRLTKAPAAAAVAGIVFGFAPTRFDHYQLLELLWAFWMPLALLALHRTLASGRLRDGMLTGALFAAQVFSGIYSAVFFATALVLVGPILFVLAPSEVRRRAALALVAGGLVAGVLCTPYVVPYQRTRTALGERAEGTTWLYGAGPKHYLAAMPESMLYGRLMGGIGREEKRLFPGFLVIGLVGVAAVARPDGTRAAYALLALVAVLLSFGPPGLLFEWLRAHVFVYRGLRVPARAGYLALLAFAVLAAYGLQRVSQTVANRRLGPTRAVAMLIGALILAEYWIAPLRLVPVPARPSAVYEWIRSQPRGAVAELPMPLPAALSVAAEWPRYDAQYQYLSTFHWQPLVNGYTGDCPAAYDRLQRAVRDFPNASAIDALRRAGATYLVVHERFMGTDAYRSAVETLNRRSDLVAYGPFEDYGRRAQAYRLLAP